MNKIWFYGNHPILHVALAWKTLLTFFQRESFIGVYYNGQVLSRDLELNANQRTPIMCCFSTKMFVLMVQHYSCTFKWNIYGDFDTNVEVEDIPNTNSYDIIYYVTSSC